MHGQITREALKGTFSDINLQSIITANESQDIPGGEGALEPRRHFDGTNLHSAVAYIDREKKRAINLGAEADSDGESRADALRHIGTLMHTVQDFYLRTNYVELQLENPAYASDPFNIPLVDWSKIPDGYIGTKSGATLKGASYGSAVDEINKDTAETAGGKKVVSGEITQFAVAKELAVRETQRQWNLLETLIRSRCGEKASKVLAALRQAAGEKSPESKSE